MKLYSAHKEGGCSEINQNFERILGEEKFLVYFGQGVEVDLELEGTAVFSDDIGRGGGGITSWGEVYDAVQYMASLALSGVVGGISYSLFEKYTPVIKKLFKKSKTIGKTLHFNVDIEGGSQYHFVFFSYITEEDLENGWKEISKFVSEKEIPKNTSVDCYFDTKSKKWHIVGERDLSSEYEAKYRVY